MVKRTQPNVKEYFISEVNYKDETIVDRGTSTNATDCTFFYRF